MTLSSEDGDEGHPYWYARVLDIFHAHVRVHVGRDSKSSESQRMDETTDSDRLTGAIKSHPAVE